MSGLFITPWKKFVKFEFPAHLSEMTCCLEKSSNLSKVASYTGFSVRRMVLIACEKTKIKIQKQNCFFPGGWMIQTSFWIPYAFTTNIFIPIACHTLYLLTRCPWEKEIFDSRIVSLRLGLSLYFLLMFQFSKYDS